MKILLFGGSGQLGTALIPYLSTRGHIVMAPTRSQFNLKTKKYCHELWDAHCIKSLFDPDLIINCAAYTNVDQAQTPAGIRNCAALNRDIPALLSRVSSVLQIPIIHFSTDYVFHQPLNPGDEEAGWREETTPLLPPPEAIYARTKREGEVLVAQNNPDHYIIRVSWLAGLQSDQKNFLNFILRYMMDASFHNDTQSIKIINDQFGSLTSVYHVAQLVHEIMKNRPPSGIYHMSSGPRTTWFEVANQIKFMYETYYKKDVPLSIVPISTAEFIASQKKKSNSPLAVRPVDSYLCKDKIKSVLGFKVPTLHETIELHLLSVIRH